MKYTIYRGSEVVVADVEIQGSVTEKIMGEETASLTFSAYEKIEFHIGDKITIFGRDYFLSTEPVTEKINSRLFNYTLVFFSLKYILSDIQLFFYDNDNELTIPDFDIMGNASTCLDAIIANVNRIDSGWTKGDVDETEVKLISFSSVNCLEAVSKIADEFELEYWIDSDKSIHFTERKPVSGYSFSYGQSQGLKNIKRSILEGGSLCTRLYVKGSTQNLPKNYRSGQKNLRIDVPYLEKNTSIYGVKEHTETFDIFPKYEGTVTAISETDFNIFSDANLDFDLNAYNEYGTTVLKAGVTAKIIFQTGQLAGYTIELLEAGGFNSATKTFYLNRVKDEADIVVPSELLRPAIGDKYIIVDIMMPEAYVLAAETLLKTKAQEYLDKNSRERFQYAVVSDPFYFEAQNVNIPLGSTVHFIDSDFGLDDDLRVIGKKTNVQDRYSVELELSEETQVSSIVKSYYEQQKTQNTIINNLKYNAEQARRNYLFGREFHDKVFDGEDYFKAENIKPLSIETKMLSLGSRLQQFGLPGVSFKIENNNTLINTSGKIVHQTINPDAVREWNIAANSVTDISANFNYIFIECQRVGTNASFVVSETPIKVEADADFYHFEVGYLSSIIEGYRKIKTTYGFAQLNPAELSIGRIADPSGNNFIELKEDGIDISAKVIFKSGSSGYENLTDKPDLSSFEQTRDYVNSTLQTDLADLKNRADGVIESWFYSHTPTLSNLPASNWVTTEERNAHIGDTFTNMQEFVDNVTTPDAGKAWRFVKNETTGEFSWSLIANSDSTKALIEAGKAKDTADAKRRVFVSQPYPPYNVGDLWVQGDGGDIMRCKFERLSGSFVATDFEKASKYTDDTAVNNLQIGGRNLYAFKNLGNYYGGDINTNKSFFTVSGSRISVNSNPHDLLGNKVTVVPGSDILIHGKTDLPSQWVYYQFENGSQLTLYVPTVNGRFQFSLTVPNNATYLNIGLGEHPYSSPYYLEDVKIELGNKATDWTPAHEDVEATILQSKTDSIAAAKAYSDAQDSAKEITIKAYADGVVTAAEQRSITDATNKAEAAKTYATAQDALLKSQLEAYADGIVTAEEQERIQQMQDNLAAAKSYADAQDNLAKIAAAAYADGIVDAEEARAIADATAKMEAAKTHAQSLVNNLQIGGRNMLRDSKQPNFDLYDQTIGSILKLSKAQYPDLESDITYIRVTGGTSDYSNIRVLSVVGVPKSGELVSLSFKVKNFINPITLHSNQGGRETEINVTNQTTLVKWEGIVGDGYGQLQIQIRSLSADLELYIWDVMYEKGNKATDWTPAPEDIDAQFVLVNQEITDVDNKLENLKDLTDTVFSDGIISVAEARAIEKYINTLNAEKADISAKYTTTYNDINLTDKTPLQTAWNNYDVSHGQLITSINSAISDGKTTTAEKADVDAKFADYKNKLAALSTAFENALKAIEQKRIDDIQIGGRNLVLNSNVDITGIGLLKVFNLSESLVVGEVYTASMKGTASDGKFNLWGNLNAHQVLNLPSGTSGVVSVVFTVPNWTNLTQVSVYNEQTANPSTLNWIKIEKGNKATDWTPAPEDIQLQIDVESAKVINLEHKTDFLTGTTIEGNAIATGTLLVGNSDGTNAGITGLGSTSDGVYLWGGGTYQQMVQGLAKKEQRRNGIDIWRHPNGQIGFEIGIKDGRLIFNGYHSSGFKLFELDPNRGLVNVSYSQESWTETPFRKLTYSSSTYDEPTIASEIQGFLIKQSQQNYLSPPPYGPESEFVYVTTYSVTQNAVGYDYDNGTNPANASYESLKGMKANNNDRNNNIANGWYMSSIGEIHMESEWNSYPPMTYTFTVYVYYYQDGKITQTKVVTITK